MTERENMIFPFRWFETLTELDDGELRAMLTAIGAYAATGEVPEFKGAMKALWNEIKQRIDYDAEKREAICEIRRQVGARGAEFGKLGGRPRKTSETANGVNENPKKPQKTPNGVTETPKNPIADAKADADIMTEIPSDKSSGISPETPELFGVTGAAPARKKRNSDSGIYFDYEGDRRLHGVSADQLARWQEFYDGIDVKAELRNASGWLDGNRRKIDIKAFLVNWLKKAQDRSQSAIPAAPRYGKQPVDYAAVEKRADRLAEELRRLEE